MYKLTFLKAFLLLLVLIFLLEVFSLLKAYNGWWNVSTIVVYTSVCLLIFKKKIKIPYSIQNIKSSLLFSIPLLAVGSFLLIKHLTVLFHYFLTSIINIKNDINLGSADLLGALLVGPVCEELIYRVILLQGIINQYKNLKWSIFLSALLFSFGHFIRANIYILIGAFLMGLLLGWIFIKTRNILIPIFVHVLYNASIIFYPTLHKLFIGNNDPQHSIYLVLINLLIGLFIFVLGVFLFKKVAINKIQYV